LVFSLNIAGTTDLQRTQKLNQILGAIAKPGLIMYKASSTMEPIFFRTFRSDTYSIDKEGKREAWTIHLNVTAQPFAIGLRRQLPSVTVGNDPAVLTPNAPTYWDFTGIVGDVPAPAVMRMTSVLNSLMTWRTQNNPTALNHWIQAESGTLGTDTASAVLAGASGGNAASVAFTTQAGLVNRATYTIPTASPSEAIRGKYRLLVRAKPSASGAAFLLQYQQNPSGSWSNGSLTALRPTATDWTVVDLGLIEFPAFPAPTGIGYSNLGPEIGVSEVAVRVQRLSGTGSLYLDYIYLLPASEGFCNISISGAAPWLILDGPNDMTYGMASGSTPFGSGRVVDNAGALSPRFGTLPTLTPGVTNRFYFLRTDNTATTSTVDISTYYWPQWRAVPTS
jgi:hypothetical protein